MIAGLSAALVSVTVWVAVVVIGLRATLRRTPAGVVKALRAGNGTVQVRVPAWPGAGGTWNPAKPLGRNNPIFDPGTGRYHLDPSGAVHLDWTPRHGSPRRYEGRIPDELEPGSTQRRRVRKIGTTVLVVYLAFAVGGFLGGYLLTSGGSSTRVGFGFGGLAAALVAIWVVVLMINVVHGTRSALRARTADDKPTT